MNKREIVEYEPTEIVKISVGDLTVPVDTATELSKLALVEKSILVDLLSNAEKDEKSGKTILHPETLAWAKELRMILKDINELTRGVQEKAMIKQMDIVADIYKAAVKNMNNEKIIKIIKELEHGGKSTINVTSES